MAELTNIASDLSKGKRVEENLPRYAAGMELIYNRLSHIKLALDLFSFAQVYGEDDGISDELKSYAGRLTDVVQNTLEGHSKMDDFEQLRNEIIARMEILTSFVDRFQIYEYVINRLEYKYKESDLNMDYYDDKFEKDILSYIVSDKDNSIVNLKITQVVGQLPMRLSKNKFFDVLKNTFSLYKGNEVKSMEDFVYSVRSQSMLLTPDGFKETFPTLTESLEVLEKTDYMNLDEDGFEKIADCLDEATEYVNGLTDISVMFMDALNDAYTMALSSECVCADAAEKAACTRIIGAAVNAIREKALPSEELFADFVSVEGIQEKLFMQLSKESYGLDVVKNSFMDKLETTGTSELYNKLFKMELLNSGSSFVPLTQNEASAIADEVYVEEQSNKIIEELKKVFDEKPRCVNRAIMASILSALPVFFNDSEELKQYVHVALNQCKDDAEKIACMQIMLDLMAE